jgi:hypothetical protein
MKKHPIRNLTVKSGKVLSNRTERTSAVLKQTVRVFEKIADHAREGGTFRTLIYDRLGFGTEAYFPLYLAGGMQLSNILHEYNALTSDAKSRTGGSGSV